MGKKKQEHECSVEVVGRLGRDPELKTTDKGVPYAKLFVSTTDRFDRADGVKVEDKQWHNATVWGDKAHEIASQFKKGDSVALSGDLRINTYEKDGGRNRVEEITVKGVRLNTEKALEKNDSKIIGVINREPQASEFSGGRAMTRLSVATTTMVNGKERTDFHSVTAWGENAIAARALKKDDLIQVEGPVKHRTFDDKEKEGVTRRMSSIECQRFQVLERAKDLGVAPEVRKARSKGVEQGM